MHPATRIRFERPDLTDYVVHLTKPRFGDRQATGLEVLLEILHTGSITPHFAPRDVPRLHKRVNTVKGPDAAVCLTEQPIWALLISRRVLPDFYSGYGIAYHKTHLHCAGGRPAIYGTYPELGKLLMPGEEGYEEGKEIYTGGLPRDLQYLWTHYNPPMPGSTPGADFTWEREWRVKPRDGLRLVLSWDFPFSPHGVILVEKDHDVSVVTACLQSLIPRSFCLEIFQHRIASLETAERKLEEGDTHYAKLDTWPFPPPPPIS